MDNFPKEFTRQMCIQKMALHQQNLIKETREIFYESIIKFTEESNPVMTLCFPERLWHKHKITIIVELLERFGKLKVISDLMYGVTRTISDTNDLPTSISRLVIEFPTDIDIDINSDIEFGEF